MEIISTDLENMVIFFEFFFFIQDSFVSVFQQVSYLNYGVISVYFVAYWLKVKISCVWTQFFKKKLDVLPEFSKKSM